MNMRRSRWWQVDLVIGVGVASVLSLAGAAQAHTRVGPQTRGAGRPSAHRVATLSGATSDFSRLAAGPGTVVAQGAETDVFARAADGWQTGGPAATLADPNAPAAGTGLAMSRNVIVAGFGFAGAHSVEDVFVKPAAGWSGASGPAARLAPPSGRHTLVGGVIAGQIIAAQTTDAQQPMGPVGVYLEPTRGWSKTVRPSARLVPSGAATTGYGLAVSARAIFVSHRASVSVYTRPQRGWSGTIKPSARLRATGAVSTVGTAVLVGNELFAAPRRGWRATIRPAASITAPVPSDQAGSATTIVTSSVSIFAGGCVSGCPAQAVAVIKPPHGWVGHLHRTAVVRTTSQTGRLPAALSGHDLFLTGGADVAVYRLDG
jgi:hypothetical protein